MVSKLIVSEKNSSESVFGPFLVPKAVYLTFPQPVLACMGHFGVQFIAISRKLLLATSFLYPLLLVAAKNCFICISHSQQICSILAICTWLNCTFWCKVHVQVGKKSPRHWLWYKNSSNLLKVGIAYNAIFVAFLSTGTTKLVASSVFLLNVMDFTPNNSMQQLTGCEQFLLPKTFQFGERLYTITPFSLTGPEYLQTLVIFQTKNSLVSFIPRSFAG